MKAVIFRAILIRKTIIKCILIDGCSYHSKERQRRQPSTQYGYCYSKDKKNTVGVQYWKCAVRSCPGRAHTTGNDEVQLLKSTDHDHEPNMDLQ